MLSWILVAAGAVTLVFYVKEKIRAYSVTSLILKTAVSVFFMLTAMSALSENYTVFGITVIAGLLLGLLGDVWLDLKLIYPLYDRVYTYTGFVSFLIGHLFFIAGMIGRWYELGCLIYIAVPVALAVIVGIMVGVIGTKLGMKFGEFKTVSMVYGGVLFAMASIAGGLALYNGLQETALNMMFVGGVLFAASDYVLCGTYFAGKERKTDIILNYITYYSAQFIIALSLLYA